MDRHSPLHAVLTDSIIRALAGERYYQRGVDYFRRNLVQSLEHSDDLVEAVVCGTDDYTVTLSTGGGRFRYTCECPLGDEGAFCKHCVATALAWLAGAAAPSPGKPAGKKAARPIGDDDIRTTLSRKTREALIEQLIDWSHQDKSLRQRLIALARVIRDPLASVTQVRAQLEKAIQVRGYHGYDQAGAYAGRVDSALDAVEIVLRQGHATPVVATAMAAGLIDLCEDAMRWLENAIGNIDDSDGQGTELMQRIAGLHLQACELARPDPEALGLRLFSLEMSGNYGQWSEAAARYAHLLGESGLAAFRAGALKAWAKVPHRNQRDGGERHYGITCIMESLALQSGDVEQLVAVYERDLSYPLQYERIACAYRDAGIFDKALHWAERGMAVHTGDNGAALRLFVAEEYRRAERHADALRLLWPDFRGAPSLSTYKLIENFARTADDWDDWRDRALGHIRKMTTGRISAVHEPPASSRDRWRRDLGHSLLVEIFLYERNSAEAWREAQAGGCPDTLWLELAAQLGKTQPADAFPIYLRLGEQTIADTGNGRYEAAIQLFEKAAALMHELGRSEEFVMQFEALRRRFKAKRNLQKVAEARRPYLYLQSHRPGS